MCAMTFISLFNEREGYIKYIHPSNVIEKNIS